MSTWLKSLVDPDSNTPASRAFDLTIVAFIVVALLTFSLETIPDLPRWAIAVLDVIEVVTVVVFTFEYALRFWAAERKLAFVFSFYGLIDLLAILPFYIRLFYVGLGLDLRSLRILRLFRIFRALKLLRYSKAMRNFRDAINEVREELILYLMATAFLIFLAAMGIYYFERDEQPEQFSSVFHCLWWAVVTLTTVGYGDVYPATVGGKVFTGFLLLLGLGVIAIPSGLIASGLTQAKKHAEEAAEDEAGEKE